MKELLVFLDKYYRDHLWQPLYAYVKRVCAQAQVGG